MTEAIQKINYPSNETAEYEYDFGSFSGTKSHTLPASLFEYGKAKLITFKGSGKSSDYMNTATGKFILPSGGSYIIFSQNKGFEFITGGAELTSFGFYWSSQSTVSNSIHVARVA